jgi:RNA polymerase sigma-70 factor (ECF subfamily)
MSTGESSIPRDEWLAHAQALRRLAASLVGDEHEAHDLVQETWLRASDADLDSRREAVRGPWLRTVLRNLVRDRSRERARRAWTERNAARGEELPSSDELVERLEIAQRVAYEVVRLSEPYRTAIHLRYFEGLSPEEIARRSRVPLETVRTRLRRGLAQLRERMDDAYGGKRDAWCVALAALALRKQPVLATSIAGTLGSIGGILMSAKVLASSALIVLAAGSFVLWQRSKGTELSRDAAQPSRPVVTLASQSAKSPAPSEAVQSSSRTPVAASAAPAAASVDVRGTVTITDEDGGEHTDESGVLEIATGTNDTNVRFVEVPVDHGHWSTRIAPGNFIAFAKLVARDREAVLPNAGTLTPGPDPIAVQGRWLKHGRLRVVDAATKQDLSDVEVRCAERGWRANAEWTHPGDDERIGAVVEHATSPIDLPDRTSLTPYWVHAPQHAWGRVTFDHKVGGQRTIELSPTPSTVTIAIDGSVPKNSFVRLYPTERVRTDIAGGEGIHFTMPEPDRMPAWLAAVSIRASSTAMRIDDLQSGKFLAAVEVGESEAKLRIGSAPIEVIAGEAAHATISIDATLLEVQRTRLYGTVEVPEGLERGSCSLVLKRIDGGEKVFTQLLSEMSFAPEHRETLRWDAGSMRTGDYVAYFTNIQHRELVHAPGPGETPVALKIPPLSTVSVEVVDAATGKALDPERLQRSDGPIEGVSVNMSLPLRKRAEPGRFELVAPHGEVEISCHTSGYEDAQRKLTLASSAESCRLELVRATAIRVVMREGDAALDVGFGFLDGMQIRRVGGDEPRATTGRSTESEKVWYLDAPGRYELTFPAHAGFEPLEPRTVDVAAGQTVDVIVQVRRKP